ncbi:DUF4139 domain-containing protein [Phaeobacter sp. HF9A]|uniref:DUF4139 domain-containing protein n=1 Tax=Phaeobacter sp. HF9A TaxID=2721561 RepID=UPI0014315205|nr:DUF4139 domain-containing protein [Phaeobacter sp. HF9A]NIZ13114.1 mucoidy inhibitor MuiA family protein [Phaeobacter sp. HF9A]
MRFLLPLAASLLASTALAETFVTQSTVSDVTVYPSQARITRSAEITLPQGRHRIVIKGLPASEEVRDNLRIHHPGLERVALRMRRDFPVIETPDSPERSEAEARVKEITTQIDAIKQQAAEARLAAEGAKAAIGFLDQMGQGKGGKLPAPDELRALIGTISEETAKAGATILRAEAQSREIETRLKDLKQALASAQAELDALSQQDDEQIYLALDVIAPQDVTVPITLSYLSRGVRWTPSYEFDLHSGDTPAITLHRDIRLSQETGEDWEDVALRVSTSTPDQTIAPSELYARLYRIEDPIEPKARYQATSESLSRLAEPLVEAPMIVDEADDSFRVEATEAGVSYTFAEPVSVRSAAELAYLSLPPVELEAEVIAQAVPLQDETAYRIARVSNDSGEELLPAEARFLLDGELIGRSYFTGLTPEAETELGFGPIDGLRISRALLDQSEGGRGVISRSNQRNTVAEIEVENLTGRVWPLRVLDRVPYSEQEELEISWSASPTPSEENVDKQRGILAWDLEMQPASTRVITLNTRLDWPEGKVLR